MNIFEEPSFLLCNIKLKFLQIKSVWLFWKVYHSVISFHIHFEEHVTQSFFFIHNLLYMYLNN